MPRATIKLSSGTVVEVEGTVAEVRDLLAFYGKPAGKYSSSDKISLSRQVGTKDQQGDKSEELEISQIVQIIKDCDEAINIETKILDTTSQVNRILLPLYVVQKYMHGKRGLTTGDISAITKELGIPIHIANVSNAIKGSASRYVIGDKVRSQGQPVKYKLSRRGVQYLENVIKGTSDGE